ncbi:MAG: hypothetical protein LBE36_02555 [Flavobacteriaceae bacterium]|jgi:uncharacterized membrane protein|nr:hypothetical protein [Flavobacteriaceae bacterium]
MNNAHLHLVVNHLPIIFPIVGIVVLLIGIFTKSEVSKRNAYIIFILGALASVLAMATGDGAEEAVEHIAGVSKNLIHEHEESSELFAGISYLLGGISLLAFVTNIKKFPFAEKLSLSKYLPFVVGIFSLITLIFAQKAGTTGGEIRHTEIRSGNLSPLSPEGGKEENRKEVSENKDSKKENHKKKDHHKDHDD